MFSTRRPKRALLSYVNSGISKNNLLNTRRSSSIKTEGSKVNKKNQMKVSDDGNLESLCTTRCRREGRYMIVYIELSVADNTMQSCHQRKPKEFHNH